MLMFFLKKRRKIILCIAIPLVVLVVAMVGLAHYGGYPYPFPANQTNVYREKCAMWIGKFLGYREIRYYPNSKIKSVEHWKFKPASDICWETCITEKRKFIWADYFDLEGNRIGFIRNGNGLLIRMHDNGQVRSIETVANGNSFPSGLIVDYYADGTPSYISYSGDENRLGLSIALHPDGRLKDSHQYWHRKQYGKHLRWNADGTPDTSPRQ